MGRRLELLEVRCPTCGGPVDTKPKEDTVRCGFCDAFYLVHRRESGELETRPVEAPRDPATIPAAPELQTTKDRFVAECALEAPMSMEDVNALAEMLNERYGVDKTFGGGGGGVISWSSKTLRRLGVDEGETVEPVLHVTLSRITGRVRLVDDLEIYRKDRREGLFWMGLVGGMMLLILSPVMLEEQEFFPMPDLAVLVAAVTLPVAWFILIAITAVTGMRSMRKKRRKLFAELLEDLRPKMVVPPEGQP